MYEYLDHITRLDLYILFLFPLLELAIILIASICISLFMSNFGVVKYISVFGLLSIPFILNLVTVLAIRNYPLAAVIGTCIFAGGAGFLFVKRKDY
jgi:hypothetical protein